MAPPKGIGATGKGSSRRWGRCSDNGELLPTFGVSDYGRYSRSSPWSVYGRTATTSTSAPSLRGTICRMIS